MIAIGKGDIDPSLVADAACMLGWCGYIIIIID